MKSWECQKIKLFGEFSHQNYLENGHVWQVFPSKMVIVHGFWMLTMNIILYYILLYSTIIPYIYIHILLYYYNPRGVG